VIDSSITPLFPSPTMVDVLRLILLNSDASFYQSEIVNRTGHALLKVQHALKRIEDAGLVLKFKQGRMTCYRINKDHLGFEDLKRLFLKAGNL
jgi:hypothetical protein